MAKKHAKKRVRKCSICRTPGHTKRTCQRAEDREPKKTTGKKKTVVVRVEGADHSVHTVQLRKKQKEQPEIDIPVFVEQPHQTKKRVTIDFASAIIQANKDALHRFRVEQAKLMKKDAAPAAALPQELQVPDVVKAVTPVEKIARRFKETSQERRAHNTLTRIQVVSKKVNGWLDMRIHWRRLAWQSVILFLVVAIPFPALGTYHKMKQVSAEVVSASTDGFFALQSSTIAALHSNIGLAQTDLNSALESFSHAENILDQEYQAVQFIAGMLPVVGKQVKSRQHILTAGHHLALGNTYLIKGIQEANVAGESHMTDRMELLTKHLRGAIPQYEQAFAELAEVEEEAVPVEYQKSVKEFKLLFATFINDLHDVVDLGESMASVFGSEDYKRYLVVFQNNHELRATGGFWGSLAIVDVQKGKILNVEVPGGGLYDWKGQLSEHVRPPVPLQLVNERWEAQDANWWPEFEASAKKLQWFYEKSRGATVDGVIAVNADVLPRVLEVLGPLEQESYGVVLEASTALETLQEEVELNYDKKENTPKAIIGDALTGLLETDIEQMDVMRLLTVWHSALERKDIQIQMNDPAMQREFRSYGWTGSLAQTARDQDYLMVVHSNIHGAKSDAKMEDEVEYQAVVEEDGSILSTVIIRRTHTGVAGEQFYGDVNVDYVRVYVPEGAKLVDAGGFQYPPEHGFRVPKAWYEEDKALAEHEKPRGVHPGSGTHIADAFGKTVFGNWIPTAPGDTSEVYLTYRLPFKAFQPDTLVEDVPWTAALMGEVNRPASRYSLMVQKQSGTYAVFRGRVIYPAGWTPAWRTDDAVNLARNGAQMETLLEEDQLMGVVMELTQ